MVETQQMKPGVIVREPGLETVPPEKRYFRVRTAHHAELGPWDLEQVSGGNARTLQLGDLERLELVDPEPYVDANFEGFVGRKVRLTTRWGSTITGRVGYVRTFEFTFDGDVVALPDAFIVDTEEFKLSDIVSVDILE